MMLFIQHDNTNNFITPLRLLHEIPSHPLAQVHVFSLVHDPPFWQDWEQTTIMKEWLVSLWQSYMHQPHADSASPAHNNFVGYIFLLPNFIFLKMFIVKNIIYYQPCVT